MRSGSGFRQETVSPSFQGLNVMWYAALPKTVISLPRYSGSDAESHSKRTQRTSCPRAGTSPKDRVLYRTCPTFRQHEFAETLIPLHKTCAFSTTAISLAWESRTIERMRYLCVGCGLRDQASIMVRLAMPLAVNGQRRRSCSLCQVRVESGRGVAKSFSL
jgi:hypothetical protein